MNVKQIAGLSCLILGIGIGSASGAEPAKGYQKKVKVSAPTRLDWTFAVATQSVPKPPANWLPADYDATKQHYELFVPPNYNPKQSYPLVLFISPGAEPMGWKHWEAVCKQHGVLFAGTSDAGNDCPPKKRVRIALDVFDDVRRHYRVDADRTYVTGFSGGGRIACGLTFAMPELFGGAVPICATGDLRPESWLRHRLIDRLSVALVTGETDFNRGEVERWKGPLFKDIGVRTKTWVFPKLGHGVPSGQQLQEVFAWLEENVKQRRELAKRFPATRLGPDVAPSREEWSKTLLAEGKQRLEAKETLYSGLMLLQGCMKCWPDLAAGAEAKKTLLSYEDKPDKPWEADDIAEQRRFLIASARSLDAYASGPLPNQYAKDLVNMAKQALEMWELIQKDGPDTAAGKEAAQRITALQKIIDDKGGK